LVVPNYYYLLGQNGRSCSFYYHLYIYYCCAKEAADFLLLFIIPFLPFTLELPFLFRVTCPLVLSTHTKTYIHTYTHHHILALTGLARWTRPLPGECYTQIHNLHKSVGVCMQRTKRSVVTGRPYYYYMLPARTVLVKGLLK